ncbi:MAG: type II toxin-antitoxin system prevent-host-death family antitoxin [Bryobacterales bacterium]|nr:type II toxin-antitoxin system prevent-host-death family antitoxin [Bryobacterales bacterium]
MMEVDIHTAKTTLSKLANRAEAGEEIIITRRGRCGIRLVPIEKARPVLGTLRGKAEVADRALLFAMPEEEAEGFIEGNWE